MTSEEKLEKSMKRAEKLGVFKELKKIHQSMHKKSK